MSETQKLDLERGLKDEISSANSRHENSDTTPWEEKISSAHAVDDWEVNEQLDTDAECRERDTARYERPPVVQQARVDEDGTYWSIEVAPLNGETREECQKRITEYFESLRGELKYGTLCSST